MTVTWDPASVDGERSVIMLARTTQLKITRDALTRRIIFEVVEYDLILGKTIRSSRDVVIEKAEIELADPRFARYFVRKMEQRLLFNLGMEELPL